MQNLRISSTLIENFRAYWDGDKLYGEPKVSHDKLIEYITGEFKPTVYTERGKAFHSILENTPELQKDGEKEYYQVFSKEMAEYYKFDRSIFREIYARNKDMFASGSMAELKIFWKFPYTGYEVNIVSMADRICGKTIAEWKTQWGNKIEDFNDGDDDWYKDIAGEYERSMQWRLYLHGFKAGKMRYTVAQLYPAKKNYFVANAISSFELEPYSGMECDIRFYVGHLLEFIFDNKLEKYFDRESDPEAVYG